MTMDDTRKFLMTVNAFFPTWKVDNPAETAAAWKWALEEYPPEVVNAALRVYIQTNNSGFAPSVSQIISCIYSAKENDQMTEGDAWALVKKAISDGYYHSKERYDELPELVQKAVGNPAMLKEWATTDSESVNTVIMSNFQRNYRRVCDKKEFNDRIDPKISVLLKSIETKGQKMIGGMTE